MRISDWSSDVCSSDLPSRPPKKHAEEQSALRRQGPSPNAGTEFPPLPSPPFVSIPSTVRLRQALRTGQGREAQSPPTSIRHPSPQPLQLPPIHPGARPVLFDASRPHHALQLRRGSPPAFLRPPSPPPPRDPPPPPPARNTHL